MGITEKDIDEFLEFRSRFTANEWAEINHYVDCVLNRRKNDFVLTDSEVEYLRELINKNRFTL